MTVKIHAAFNMHVLYNLTQCITNLCGSHVSDITLFEYTTYPSPELYG